MTGTELLAVASGFDCSGGERCVFCGSPANTPYELPSSFTTRDTLRMPGSKFICAGCVLAMQESGTACYHDGTTHEWTKAFRRMCSHVISRGRVIVATKGHLPYLLSVCVNPPEPPFVISLAVSGQKHVLYRSIVCYSRESVTVTLEGERVDYTLSQIRERVRVCGNIVAATGKPALEGAPNHTIWSRVCDRYGMEKGLSLCSEWEKVYSERLSCLVSFLIPKKEDCEREYPGNEHS